MQGRVLRSVRYYHKFKVVYRHDLMISFYGGIGSSILCQPAFHLSIFFVLYPPTAWNSRREKLKKPPSSLPSYMGLAIQTITFNSAIVNAYYKVSSRLLTSANLVPIPVLFPPSLVTLPSPTWTFLSAPTGHLRLLTFLAKPLSTIQLASLLAGVIRFSSPAGIVISVGRHGSLMW